MINAVGFSFAILCLFWPSDILRDCKNKLAVGGSLIKRSNWSIAFALAKAVKESNDLP